MGIVPLGAIQCAQAAGGADPGDGRRRGQFRIHILQRVLDVRELLIELAQPRLQVGDVVREALDLRAHRVQARAGSRGEVLRGLLDGGHGSIELVHGVQRLLDERALHGGILRDLGLHVLLALNQLGHAGLQFNDFARHGACRRGPEQGAAKSSREHGGAEK